MSDHKFEPCEVPTELFADKDINVSEDTFKAMFKQSGALSLLEKLYQKGLIIMEEIEEAANKPVGDVSGIQFGSTVFHIKHHDDTNGE